MLYQCFNFSNILLNSHKNSSSCMIMIHNSEISYGPTQYNFLIKKKMDNENQILANALRRYRYFLAMMQMRFAGFKVLSFMLRNALAFINVLCASNFKARNSDDVCDGHFVREEYLY